MSESCVLWNRAVHAAAPWRRQRRLSPALSDAMPHLLSSSVSYRIAVGPQRGRKAFMIRTIQSIDSPDPGLERVAKANGFSLHAGVSCEGHQKGKRERLCRYIARPALAVPRLSLSSTGKVLYTLKTPYRDGTTQVVSDRGGHPPVDFIARLAALARARSDQNPGSISRDSRAYWHRTTAGA